MKSFIFLWLGICLASSAFSQKAGEWLCLPPFELEKPCFSENANVNGIVYNEIMGMGYAGIPVSLLYPKEGHSEAPAGERCWKKVVAQHDTLVLEKLVRPALFYYAVYLENKEWTSGSVYFRIVGNAEVYVDGMKKNLQPQGNGYYMLRDIWLPGKHTIVVKALNAGGKVLYAEFVGDKGFEKSSVKFSVDVSREITAQDILDGRFYQRLELSADGRFALVGFIDIRQGNAVSTHCIYETATHEILYSFPGNSAEEIKWIPGSNRLSFLQNEGNSKAMCVYDVEKRTLKRLFGAEREINSYTWAPDASYMIYKVWESYNDAQWRLKKLEGIEDRTESFRSRSFLYRYDLKTGLRSRLTWGNLSTDLMDISRDGKQLLFSTTEPVYDIFPYAQQSVYRLEMNTMSLDTLWKNRTVKVECHFSPDGSKLLVTGGPSAFGSLGENLPKKMIPNQTDKQLYLYDLASNQPQILSWEFVPSIEQAVWHENGNIYLKVTEGDYVCLYRYAEGGFIRMDCPGDLVQQISFSQGKLMYTASDEDYPSRVYLMDLTTEKTVLWEDAAAEQYADIRLGEVRDWNFRYNGKTEIEGRYYLPVDFDSTQKYPLVVYYYGGITPTARFFGGPWPFQLYTANGYVVYVMQPSGAVGYGQEFSARHQNNWGKVTGDEIIAASKAFIREHSFIDSEKVACMGASYGGFTTEYLITETDMFACAVSHAGISSISGYWGEGTWGYTYSTSASAYSFPWNRKDIYVEQSPLFRADRVKSPILLLHGTKDTNVPVGQSMSFYTALKLLKKDVELVLVKDADHVVNDYSQRMMWYNSILAYLAKYLKEEPAWWDNQFRKLNL